MRKKIINNILIFIGIPVCIAVGANIFHNKQYLWISIVIAVLSIIPFLISFEKKETVTKELIVLSVMVALSVVGRGAFAFIPHFKPVTGFVVITGIYLGRESGFLCGALSALVSNIYFGQGPWTPFQMFAWGIIGLLAGVLSKVLKNNMISLCIFGALAGVLYSLVLDIFTVLSFDGYFNIPRYIAAITTAIPVTGMYAFSNVVFLLILAKPIGNKLERIKIKYGIGI